MNIFFNRATLIEIFDRYIFDEREDDYYFIYNQEQDVFCKNNKTMQGISIFSKHELILYLEVYMDHIQHFSVLRPDERGVPDATNPVILGTELHKELELDENV